MESRFTRKKMVSLDSWNMEKREGRKMDNEERFKEYLLEGDILNRSINWIAKNMLPENIFSGDQLDDWAKKHSWDTLKMRKNGIEGMLKLMCDPENQPHQYMGDWEEAYDQMFFKDQDKPIDHWEMPFSGSTEQKDTIFVKIGDELIPIKV